MTWQPTDVKPEVRWHVLVGALGQSHSTHGYRVKQRKRPESTIYSDWRHHLLKFPLPPRRARLRIKLLWNCLDVNRAFWAIFRYRAIV